MRILRMLDEADDLVGRRTDLRTRRRTLDTLCKIGRTIDSLCKAGRARSPEELYFAALQMTIAKARLALAEGCNRELIRMMEGGVFSP